MQQPKENNHVIMQESVEKAHYDLWMIHNWVTNNLHRL